MLWIFIIKPLRGFYFDLKIIKKNCRRRLMIKQNVCDELGSVT